MSRKYQNILVIAFFAVTAILFWYKIVFFKNTIISGFFLRYFFPYAKFFAASIKEGAFPLWNPHSFCGTPFAANFQSAVFYPFSYLFVLFSFPVAIKVHTVLHTMLAGLFMYIFCRGLKLDVIASLTGGILWAFNGFYILHVYFTSNVSSYIWLPLALFFMDKALNENKNVYVVMVSAVLTIQLFGGYPIFVGLSVVMLFLYSMARPQGPLIARVKPLYVFLFVILFFILLSSVQWIPAIELIRNSVRSLNFDYDTATVYSLNFRNFLEFVFFPLWNRYVANIDGDPNIVGFYFGLAALVLVILSFFSKRHKNYSIFFGVLLLVSLLYSLGRHTPFYKILFKFVPLVGFVRFPTQMLYIATFCFCILAAIGMSHINVKRLKVILLSVILLDLWLFSGKSIQVIESGFFNKVPENVNFLKKDSSYYRVMMTPMSRNVSKMYGHSVYEAWENYRNSCYPSLPMSWSINDASGYEEMRLKEHERIYEQIKSDAKSKWIDLLNIKYMLSFYDLPKDKYKKIRDDKIKIYRNVNMMPRAFFTSKQKGAKQSSVEITTYKNEQVEIEVFSDSDGTVVLSDSFYPGWKAFVNGELSRIDRINLNMRAVSVKKGESVVKMVYEPLSFKIGLWISVLSLAGFVIIVWQSLKKRKSENLD